MSLIGLLIFLVIVGVIFWAISQLAPALNIPHPIVVVVQVLLVVIVLIYLLRQFGGGSGDLNFGL